MTESSALYFFEDAVFEQRGLKEVQTRRQRWDSLYATVQPGLHAATTQLSRTYPTLPSGILSAAAQAGIPADAEGLANLAEDFTQDQEQGWNFMKTIQAPFEAAFDATKASIRHTLTAFDAMWEEVIARPLRTTVGIYQGLSLGDAYEMAGPSIGTRALDKWLDNPLGHTLDWLLPGQQVDPANRINLGSGFLPQSDFVDLSRGDEPSRSPTVQKFLAEGMELEDAVHAANAEFGEPITRQARSQAEVIQISKGGKSSGVSPGRLVAMLVSEPETAPFNIMSGIGDVAAQIYLDPADKLLKGVKLAKIARNTLLPDGPRKATTLKAAVYGRLAPSISEFLDSSLGNDLAQWGARTNDIMEIRSVMGRKVQGANHIKWLRQLADETDPDKWKNLVRLAFEDVSEGLYANASPINLGLVRKNRRGLFSSKVGAALGGEVGKFGGTRVAIKHRLQGGLVYRMFSEMGGNAVPVGDLATAVDEIENFMSSAGFTASQMSELIYEMSGVNADNYEEVLTVVRKAVNIFGDKLKDEGIPEPAVKWLTNIFNTNESVRKYFIDQAGNPAMFPGARWKMIEGDKVHIMPTAHLFTEFVNRAIPLPKPREVRRAVNRLGAKRAFGISRKIESQADLSEGAILNLMDKYMGKIWKPMTLIRVAWPVRVIGEEQLRMVGGDLDSVFRHPIQYMGWAMHSKGRFGSKVQNVIRGERGILGTDLEEAQEYQKAMSTYRSFGLDPQMAPGPRDWMTVEKGDPRFGIAMTREITQMSADPIAREVVAAGLNAINDGVPLGSSSSYMQAVKERFMNGDLAMYRKRFIVDGEHYQLLENRRWADGYIDSIWARATDKTGGRYDYFDTNGDWFSGFDGTALPAELIPGIPGAVAGEVGDLGDVVTDMLSQIGRGGDFPSGQQMGSLMGQIDDMIQDLALAGDTARARDLDRIAGVLEDGRLANISDSPSRENQAFFRGNDDAGGFVRQGLDDLSNFLDEGGTALKPPKREFIAGNEAEDLLDAAKTPRAGRDVEPFPAAMETIDPMSQMDANRVAAGTPNGAIPIFGTDTKRPITIAVVHDEILVMQVGIDWDAEGIIGLHISSADLSGMPDIPFPSNATNMATAMAEIDKLGGIKPETILDMFMGGVPVRDWLMSSPALRHLGADEAMKMSPSELLGKIADSTDELGFGVDDVVESLRATPLGRDPVTGLSFGVNDERQGVMYAQAFRFEMGELWDDLVSQARDSTQRRPTIGDTDFGEGVVRISPDHDIAATESVGEFIDDLDNSVAGPFLQRLEAATGNGLEARLALQNALEAEFRINPDQLRGVAADMADARSALTRSALPLLTPPGNYPMTFDGARAGRALIRRQLRPEMTKQIPLDRPMYHTREAGNIELLEAIASGNLRGLNIRKVTTKVEAQKIARLLTGEFDNSMPRIAKTTIEPDKDLETMWDAAISTMFSEFMSKPTNQLSRSPAFRQFYWRRVARMMPFLDEASQTEMLRRASEAGVEESFLRNELRNFLRSLVGRDEVSRSAVELERLAQFPIQITTGSKSLRGLLEGEEVPIGLAELEDIDGVAKAYALEETKRLLYDITRKHDIADMTRNIFPFAEAWGEILTSWARIFAENPRMLRRLQQGVEGVRGSGWLYEDPATGEEVFNYPGSGLLARWMIGDNAALQLAAGAITGGVAGALGGGVPGAIGGSLLGATAGVAVGGLSNEAELGDASLSFTGRAQGLNLLAGNYLPGFGPIVQIPMNNLLSEKLADPDWRWVRDLVLPFGGQEVDSPGELLIDTALPAWFRKGLTSLARGDGDNQRLYANTVIDVYKALLTGTHTDNTPEEAALTMARAKEIAKNIYRIRAIAQFAVPTGPSVRFDIRDKTGQNWTFINLAQEWARMQQANDFDEVASFEEFTQRFGLDPTLFATAKTTSVVPRTTTEAGLDWQNKNSEFFEPGSPYFFTAYFARPDDPWAEFDYPAYLNQLDQKTRQALSPEQWVSERNDFLGRLGYERSRRMVLGRTDDAVRGWLRQIRYQLMDVYPGYNSPTVGIGKRVQRDQLLRSFQDWEKDPTLRNTEAGEGLILYLQARDEAIGIAASLGITEGGFATAKRVAHLRRWLEDVGRYYATTHPDFGPIYDRVMRHELEDEESQIAAIQAAGGRG